MLKKSKWFIGIGAVVLLLIYIGFSVFFINHYYAGTMINEEDYSFLSIKQTQNKIRDAADHYILEITGRNEGKDSVKGSDVKLEYLFDNSLDEIAEQQNGWLWITSFFKEKQYTVAKTAVFDEDALEKNVNSLSFFKKENIIEPKDAFIGEYSQKEKQYELVKEVPGTILDKKKVLQAIAGSMELLDETLNLDEAGCYEDPTITSSDKVLKETLEKMNRYVGASVTYDFVVSQEVVDGDIIQEWLSFDGRTVTIEEELVREYVNQLSKQYDTYGRNRQFVTTKGEKLELLSGGYGFRTDRAAETEQLIQEIKGGEKVIREPTYIYRGYVRGVDDIGENYVEIDLKNQHVYVYQEGKIVVETDCVSGKISNGNSTPAGVFGITYKERNAVLTGENYASPVSYWMPFNGNVGMHDAPWRKKFGGELYLSEGSHGCVNLPAEVVPQIYEIVKKGMPVICYY